MCRRLCYRIVFKNWPLEFCKTYFLNPSKDAGHQDAVDAILQHAVICEMILGRAKIHAEKDEKAKKAKMDAQGFGDNHEYLRSKLKYDKNDVEGLLLDDKEDAVMMSWETQLMKEHAKIICHNRGSVLNVGHGMGIVDRAIQVTTNFDVILTSFSQIRQNTIQLSRRIQMF